MARIANGNGLDPALLQPGFSVQSDGFGLLTSTCTFKADFSVDASATFPRGATHPDSAYSFLKAHKWSVSYDTLNIATIKVDYVGIDTSVNSGNRTNANTAAANGLTAQNITSHPNFFTAQTGFIGAIAGPAPYTEDTAGVYAPAIGNGHGFMGLNGSCFEKESGGRFVGFVDPQYKSLYGKTQYLATTTTYSGTVYYGDATNVQALFLLLGTATQTASWGTEFPLLPAWAPIGTVSGVGHCNLLSQANVEEFGSLFKVSYEIRYAKDGWDNATYINLT